MATILDPQRDALPGSQPPTEPVQQATPAVQPRANLTGRKTEQATGLTREEMAYLQKLDSQYGLDPAATQRDAQVERLRAEEAKNNEAVNAFLLNEKKKPWLSDEGKAFGEAVRRTTTQVQQAAGEGGAVGAGAIASTLSNVALGVASGLERLVNVFPNTYNYILKQFGGNADSVADTMGFFSASLEAQDDDMSKVAGKMVAAATPTIVAGFGGAGVAGQALAQVGSSFITAASADPEDSNLLEMARGTSLEKVAIVGSVVDALATSPDSSETERRWKIFLEDLGMGAAVSSAVGLWRGARSTGKRLKDAVEGTPNSMDIVVDEQAARRFEEAQRARTAQATAQGEAQAAGQLEFDVEAARQAGVPEAAMPPSGVAAVEETLEDSGQLALGDVGRMPAPNRNHGYADETIAMDMVGYAREFVTDMQTHLRQVGRVPFQMPNGKEFFVNAEPWVNTANGRANILVTAYDGNTWLGSVQVYPEVVDGVEQLASAITQVNGEFRRSGVASAMYQYIDNYIGTIHPSQTQTRLGQAFWRNRVRPPSIDAQANFNTDVKLREIESDLRPAGQAEFNFETPEAKAAVQINADKYIAQEADKVGVTVDEAMASAARSSEVFSDTAATANNVDYTETIARIARVIELQPQGRGPMTFKEIAEIGEDYAQDVQFLAKIMGREAGDIYNAEATSGISQAINNLMEDLFQQAQVGTLDASLAGNAKFAEAVSNMERLMNILGGNASEQGRALSMNASRARLFETGDQAVVNQVRNHQLAGEILQRVKQAGGPTEIANIRQLVEEAQAAVRAVGAELDPVTGAVKQISKFQRFKDGLIYFRTSNLLTSPFTTFRAAAETGTAMLGRQMQNVTDAMVTSARVIMGGDTGSDPMTWGRAYNEFVGNVEAINEGIHSAWKSIRTGQAHSATIRADLAELRPTAIKIDESGKEGYGLYLAKTMNAVGLANDLAGRRLLLGLDSVTGTMAYRGYIKGVGYNRSMHLTGEEKANFLAQFLNNPPKDVHEAAVQVAQQMGNSNRPSGWIGNFVANPLGGGFSQHPVTRDLSKLLFPFGNTRGASLENGLAKFPGTNLLVKRVREDLASGDPARVSKAMSESMVGIEAIGIMWYMFEKGMLTPVGTSDPATLNQLNKQDGWRPGAFYVPGLGYKDVPNIQALQIPLRMASLAYQYAKSDVEESESSELTAVAGAMLMTTFNTSDITGVIGTLNDMFDYLAMGDEKRFSNAAATFSANFGPSFIPFQPTVRGLNQMIDGEVKDYRSFEGFLNQLDARVAATVPGLSANIPPKRNIFGEPVYVQKGFAMEYSDVATEDQKNLQVMTALRQLAEYSEIIPTQVPLAKLTVTEMSRGVPLMATINGKTGPMPNMQVRLTPQEYDQMTFLAGQGIKLNGKTMGEALHDLLIGGKASLDAGGDGLDTAAARYLKRFHKGEAMNAEAYSLVIGATQEIINKYRQRAVDIVAMNPDVRERGAAQLKAVDSLSRKRVQGIITYGGEQ